MSGLWFKFASKDNSLKICNTDLQNQKKIHKNSVFKTDIF